MRKIITLITDFGVDDWYVGAVKGVILSICPDIVIVDITHLVGPYDIKQAGIYLNNVYSEFPKGSVHIVIVDPGVGSKRRALIVKTSSYYFVVPDNGLVNRILRKERVKGIFEIQNKKYFAKTVSTSFHGRDVFAPVAAHVLCGVAPDEIGRRVPMNSLYKMSLERTPKNGYRVLMIDHFGNVILEMSRIGLKADIGRLRIHVPGIGLVRIYQTYADMKKGAFGAIFGASGLLEIAMREGDANKVLRLKRGDIIPVECV